mgnify:FL=1
MTKYSKIPDETLSIGYFALFYDFWNEGLSLEQRFSIAGDDVLVPEVAILLVALKGRFDGFFVLVDIDEAVAFLVAVQPAEQIGERPCAVGEHFRAFFDRQFDFLEVFR